MLSRVLLILTMCVSGNAVVPETLSKSTETAFVSGFNKWRTTKDRPDLVWDSKLASAAAEHGSKCILNYSNYKFGENLYSSSPKQTDNGILANDAIQSWASNLELICRLVGQGTCENNSQVVWKNTTGVGCAIVHCNADYLGNFVVCNYVQKGNTRGQVPY